jgi:hypothetical protein
MHPLGGIWQGSSEPEVVRATAAPLLGKSEPPLLEAPLAAAWLVQYGGVIVLLILWVAIGGGVGALIGSSKGRRGLGFVLGLLLGIIGWIIMAFVSPTPEHRAKQLVPGTGTTVGAQAAMYREYPHCKEQMRRDATMCPHCRTESDPWTLHEGIWWVTRPSGTSWGPWPGRRSRHSSALCGTGPPARCVRRLKPPLGVRVPGHPSALVLDV